MIGDFSKKVGVESAKNTSRNDSIARALFSLNSEPLPPDRNLVNLAFRDDIFQTNMSYSIQYKTNASRKGFIFRSEHPFLIKADFLPKPKATSSKSGMLRISSWEDLVERGKTDKHIQWLLDWTTLTQTTFDVVKDNPGLIAYFSVDLERYVAHLKEQGCNEPVNQMLVVPEIMEMISEAKSAQMQNYLKSINKRGE